MANCSFRKALLQRQITFGTWLQINSPTAAEVLANAGYEWIVIDIEHTDIDIVSLTALLRGMYGRGVAPVARVSTNDVIEIRRALDVGAEGVLVPFVSTAEQARQALGHGCVHDPRAHRVDPDAERRQRLGSRTDHADDSGLAGSVVGRSGSSASTSHR